MSQQQSRSFGSLVSPKELKSALASVKVLDGSWHMPNTNRDPYQEFLQKRIASSQFFGIDTIKDTSSDLPHMLPSPDKFADAVGKFIYIYICAHDGVHYQFIYSLIQKVKWEFRKMTIL